MIKHRYEPFIEAWRCVLDCCTCPAWSNDNGAGVFTIHINNYIYQLNKTISL